MGYGVQAAQLTAHPPRQRISSVEDRRGIELECRAEREAIGARSNNSAWSHEPEVEGPQHARKRNDFRDTHSFRGGDT